MVGKTRCIIINHKLNEIRKDFYLAPNVVVLTAECRTQHRHANVVRNIDMPTNVTENKYIT